MERATPTPNRFITFTPSWLDKGFVLFVSLLLLGSCIDETSFIGVRRDARFKVEYHEFDLPATTVQTDSVRTQNHLLGAGDPDRLLVGLASDPNFGNTSASLFTKYNPNGKISGLSQVVAEKLTLRLALDYYVYGDTNSSNISFTVHEITDGNFKETPDYFSNSSVTYGPSLATGNYYYNQDSIRKSKKLKNRIDTLYIELPTGPGTLAQLLLDTALRKGIYSKNSQGNLVFDEYKTDSVFMSAFKGLAVLPVSSNKILGIRTLGVSGLTLHYTHVVSGVTKKAKYYYYLAPTFTGQYIPNFSKIDFDRTGSPLQSLSSNNSEFNAPDGYCYLQSGTGAFTKLNLTEVHQYFDAIPEFAINSAELIVSLEPTTTRAHVNTPTALVSRLVDGNRFLQGTNANYTTLSSYYHTGYALGLNFDYYFDAIGDNSSIFSLTYISSADGLFYRGYMSTFLQYQLTVPSSIEKIYALGLEPLDAPFGKSFHGVSFKKDKIKLKVYYTRVL